MIRIKRTTLALSVGLLLALVGQGSLQAAPVVYFGENTAAGGGGAPSGAPLTARNSFLSNLSSNVDSEGFEGFKDRDVPPLALSFQGSGATPLLARLSGSGQVFSTPAGGRFNTTAGGSNLFEVSGSFVIDFTTAISAFGFYATDIGDFDGQVTLALLDTAGGTTNLTVNNTKNGPDGSLLFWGFIDDQKSYSRITFGNTAAGVDEFGFDDMVIGDRGQILDPDPNPVPEPTSLALVGLSLLALSATRRRRRG